MMKELNTSYPTARKEHKCMFCGGTIKVGEKYERKTLIYDNQIYDWVCHLECEEAAGSLDMFNNNYDEGINGEDFIEYLKEWLHDEHYNDETDTYDDGFDPYELSYHDIVLNVIKELKEK